jgi:hypothetical protein
MTYATNRLYCDADSPHPEGTDDPIGRFERTLHGISEDAKSRFYSGNFHEVIVSTAAPKWE